MGGRSDCFVFVPGDLETAALPIPNPDNRGKGNMMERSLQCQISATPERSGPHGGPLLAVTLTTLERPRVPHSGQAWRGGRRALFEEITLETGRGVQGECSGSRWQSETWQAEPGCLPRARSE